LIENEFELIRSLSKKLPPLSSKIEIGIGDDAAVIKPVPGKLLFTVDCLVETVHFDFSYSEPEEVGYKALAVNLSDIAAMGGVPIAAVVSLGIPPKTEKDLLERIYVGLGNLASIYSVDIVGGNTSAVPSNLFINISVLGSDSGNVLPRSGAKKGDIVFISGIPGQSAAGLALLKKWGKTAKQVYADLVGKHLVPEPQLKLGSIFAGVPGVNSLIDVSDGLSSELWHLAQSSGVHFQVREERLIPTPEMVSAAEALQVSVQDWIFSGGEDYLLMGTAAPAAWENLKSRARAQSFHLLSIGEVISGPAGVELVSKQGKIFELPSSGWNHFTSSRKGLT